MGAHYRLCARLGQGGVGEVWDAIDDASGERVAVKLLRADLGCDPTRRARFLREGSLARTLRHPHIVRILAVGREDEPVPFLVMERLVGPSLADRLETEGALPWARVRRILLQICEALDHAHARVIVHHDVKPSNIVLASPHGEPEHTKLVDFGVARRDLIEDPDVALTIEGQMLGSPGYMSPEQIRGKRANPRSDLFGLGCTAYHLLTGRGPMEGTSLLAVVSATLYGAPPALGDVGLDPARHRAVEAMLHRAMRKDPGERFASARAMAAAVAAIPA